MFMLIRNLYSRLVFLVFFLFWILNLNAQNDNETCVSFIPPETIDGIKMTSTIKGYSKGIIQYDREYFDPNRIGMGDTSVLMYLSSCNPVKDWFWNSEGYIINGGTNNAELICYFSKPIFKFTFVTGGMDWGEDLIITTSDSTSVITPIKSCCKFRGDTLGPPYSPPGQQVYGAGGCGKYQITSLKGFTSVKFRCYDDEKRGIASGSGCWFSFCKCDFREFRTVRTSQSFIICFGDSVKVGNKNYKQSGKYIDTLLGLYGYDSIVTTTIKVEYKKVDILNITKCSYDKVTIAGRTYYSGGNYKDTIKTNNKCDSQIYVINIVDSTCDFKIYIPDAFTPNSEGPEINNTFQPYVENSDLFRMMIYNRWGEKIYETTDVSHGWDGTYMGEKVIEGIYVYKIQLKTHTGEKYGFSGTINLVK